MRSLRERKVAAHAGLRHLAENHSGAEIRQRIAHDPARHAGVVVVARTLGATDMRLRATIQVTWVREPEPCCARACFAASARSSSSCAYARSPSRSCGRPVSTSGHRAPRAREPAHLRFVPSRNAREGAYLGVVYGGGKAFAGMLDDLARITLELGALEINYFGDLDGEGLQIPAAAARNLGDLPLVAAGRWHELLLTRGAELVLPDVEPCIPQFALQWLPEHLRAPVGDLLAPGRRLPQVLVGWEQLRTTSR